LRGNIQAGETYGGVLDFERDLPVGGQQPTSLNPSTHPPRQAQPQVSSAIKMPLKRPSRILNSIMASKPCCSGLYPKVGKQTLHSTNGQTNNASLDQAQATRQCRVVSCEHTAAHGVFEITRIRNGISSHHRDGDRAGVAGIDEDEGHPRLPEPRPTGALPFDSGFHPSLGFLYPGWCRGPTAMAGFGLNPTISWRTTGLLMGLIVGLPVTQNLPTPTLTHPWNPGILALGTLGRCRD